MAKIRLHIGLLMYEPGWELLLRQIGISWETIENCNEDILHNYSVIILNRELSEDEDKIIANYLNCGGSILSSYKNGLDFFTEKPKKKFVSSVSPFQLLESFSSSILDLYTDCVLLSEQFITIKKETGTIAHIPFDVNSAIIDTKVRRKNFIAQKKRLPHEIVSSVSKFGVRQIVTTLLEFLHHKRNLPFIHKWYYPNGAQSIFLFRIDSDKGNQLEIEELVQVSDKYSIPTTWFLDVKSHEQWIDYFTQLQKQEIAIHCYEHETYNSIEENVNNFLHAKNILETQNLHPNGIAAPRGTWNSVISSAYEKLKIQYSSEFSYDYDNLPSFPYVSGKFSSVLQIPIHPICPGSLRRAGYTSDEMTDYFHNVIKEKFALKEPICLYHHPTHHYTDVIEKIFQFISAYNIPVMSFKEYAKWWIQRENIQLTAYYNDETKSILVDNKNSNQQQWYRITTLKNVESVAQLTSSEIKINTLHYSDSNFKITIPKNIMRARKFDWRHILISILEYYYKKRQ